MDNRGEVRDFLTSRRARLTPEQAGLPNYGGARRVKGLRREEVALLAGVSVDYYNRLERGNLSGVSDTVLDALSRALQLDESEQSHLRDLASVANSSHRSRRSSARPRVRPTIQRLLDAMSMSPAYVRNGYFDIVAHNQLAAALMPELLGGAARRPTVARDLFLDPRSEEFYADWSRVARDCVALSASKLVESSPVFWNRFG